MTKRFKIYLFILCGCIYNATAQNVINSITMLDHNYSIFTESVWHNDTLFVVGTSFTNKGRTGAIAKYLSNGSLIYYDFLLDTFTNFGTGFWDKGLFIQEDTIYHIVSKGYVGTLHNGSILKMDRNGDLLKEKEFTSFYYPEDDFCRLRDFLKTDSGFVILDYARKTETDFESCLIKTDNGFNQVWRKCYGNHSLEIPTDLLITSKGKLITIANSTNLVMDDQYIGSGNGYYSSYIF